MHILDLYIYIKKIFSWFK